MKIQVICSDKDKHQRRVESRKIDIPVLTPPTWQHQCRSDAVTSGLLSADSTCLFRLDRRGVGAGIDFTVTNDHEVAIFSNRAWYSRMALLCAKKRGVLFFVNGQLKVSLHRILRLIE